MPPRHRGTGRLCHDVLLAKCYRDVFRQAIVKVLKSKSVNQAVICFQAT